MIIIKPAGLAQSVERQALNLMVEGSSPSFGESFLFSWKRSRILPPSDSLVQQTYFNIINALDSSQFGACDLSVIFLMLNPDRLANQNSETRTFSISFSRITFSKENSFAR